MKKNIGIFLSLFLFLACTPDSSTPEEGIQEGIPFNESGVLIMNNPGFKQDIWYLAYESPGMPGLNAELVFDDETECFSGEESISCDDLHAGLQTEIQGMIVDSTVKVNTLFQEDSLKVDLYFYDPSKDTDAEGNVLCSSDSVSPITRYIPLSEDPLEDTLQLLLQGRLNLTEDEKETGVTTEFPLTGLMLIDTSLEEGILTITLDDPQNQTSGGSCRVAILWAQIEATMKQFPEVKEVRFEPEELFQP